MRTSYFTFGQNHTHKFNGITLDCDIVVEITAEDPRQKMVEYFGQKWACEYDECPNLKHYPRGVLTI